ncbi:MAG: hypothetical protein M3P85_04890 [Actinomycetota bacterium]|nr:hypothetical protein [Actinomycetota bacterium]
MKSGDVQDLVDRISRDLPKSSWPTWPGGWRGELEAALLDSVFSIRARYGGTSSGVRAVVGRWRTHRCEPLDDLLVLSEFAANPYDLVEILGSRQRLSGGLTKAGGAAAAALSLVGVGVRHACDVTGSDPERDAWCSVKGLSEVTWSYVLMLLGVPRVKADVMVRRFVGSTVGRDTSASEARSLVMAAADNLGVDATDLDHAIWSWQRQRRAAGP